MNETTKERTLGAASLQASCILSILERNGRLPDERTAAVFRAVLSAIFLAAAEGSVCTTLPAVAAAAREAGIGDDPAGFAALLAATPLAAYAHESLAGPLAGSSGKHAPVVIDCAVSGTRFYSERRFGDEALLAEKIAELARSNPPGGGGTTQDDAVRTAVQGRLAVICGGPGTGKTSVVRRVLAALLAAEPGLRIILAAPTGKAAGRLQQSIRQGGGALPENIRDALGRLEAATVHRILSGRTPGGERPSAENPLDADVIVVDECSMVDLDTAVRLFAAIDTARTRVILLGDRHQLSAVGPGSVFSELSSPDGPLASCTVELQRSYRFDEARGAGKLAAAINAGSPAIAAVLASLEKEARENPDLTHAITWEKPAAPGAGLLTPAARRWVEGAASIIRDSHPPETFASEEERRAFTAPLWEKLRDFGILAAGRGGAMGVDAINAHADSFLAAAGIRAPLWRPVIVRKNDAVLGVRNGDVGLVVPGIAGASHDVWFDDGSGSPFIRKYGLLPAHEAAFAITIHQSQGSEYHRVAVFLPSSEKSGLATRELFYTGVTRVMDRRLPDGKTEFGSLAVFSSRAVLEKAAASPAGRDGGLADRLAFLLAAPAKD